MKHALSFGFLILILSLSLSCRSLFFGHGKRADEVTPPSAQEQADGRCYNSERKRANPENLSECISATQEYCSRYSQELNPESGSCETPK